MKTLTADRLRELYVYEPGNGLLRRRTSTGGRSAGSVAGNGQPGRCIQIYVDGRNYKAHRIIWLMVTGVWPTYEVDHMDGDPSNNRWNNLRDTPHRINQQNRRQCPSHSKLKVIGVTPNRDRFGAQIKVDGKRVWLGTFDTIEQAHAVYLEAKRRLHLGCTL